MQNKSIYDLLQENKTSGEAIVCGSKRIDYKDFIGQVDDMSCELNNMAKGNNKVCIILLERTPELITAIFAALKSGMAYIPIDPFYPEEYINRIINENHGYLAVTTMKYKKYFSHSDVLCIDSKDNHTVKDIDMKEKDHDVNQIAYMIYTSGTTGKPNAVAVYVRSVINLIEGLCEIIDFNENKTIACLTSCSFDIFVVETIVAACRGLRIIMADEKEQRNPRLMSNMIIDNNIDIIQMTPSTMQMLINYDNELECLNNVSEILIGGEVFPEKLLYHIKSKTKAKIYNMYGPTETTVWSSVGELTDKTQVDIGKPIKNTEIYIMDDELNIISDNDPGEICISGAGLSMGYMNNIALTEKKFVKNKYNGKWMYRTGDYGYLLNDGRISYVGRRDNQIKLRGHRIELERIEIAARQYPHIDQAIVVLDKLYSNDDILCLYFTSHSDICIEEIKKYMSEQLPDYMVPNKFVHIDKMPLTPNNKVDRKALINIRNDDTTRESSPNVDDDITKEIINVINDVTGIEKTMLTNNPELDEIGINSVLFIRIIIKIEGVFNIEFNDDMLDIHKFKDISSITDYVEERI